MMDARLEEYLTLFVQACGVDETSTRREFADMLRFGSFLRLDTFGLPHDAVRVLMGEPETAEAWEAAFERALIAVIEEKGVIPFYRAVVAHKTDQDGTP